MPKFIKGPNGKKHRVTKGWMELENGAFISNPQSTADIPHGWELIDEPDEGEEVIDPTTEALAITKGLMNRGLFAAVEEVAELTGGFTAQFFYRAVRWHREGETELFLLREAGISDEVITALFEERV